MIQVRMLAALAALAVASCAGGDGRSPAAGTSGRDCFLASSVGGFTEATDESVILTVGPRRYYHMDTFGSCHDLDYSEVIGIRSTGGSPWICSNLDAQLIVPSVIGPQRCFVRNLRRLTDAQVEALRKPRRK